HPCPVAQRHPAERLQVPLPQMLQRVKKVLPISLNGKAQLSRIHRQASAHAVPLQPEYRAGSLPGPLVPQVNPRDIHLPKLAEPHPEAADVPAERAPTAAQARPAHRPELADDRTFTKLGPNPIWRAHRTQNYRDHVTEGAAEPARTDFS